MSIAQVATDKPRSNRPLTHFACQQLAAFFESTQGPKDNYKAVKGNTGVVRGDSEFLVTLYGEPILRIVRPGTGQIPSRIEVLLTSTFDGEGKPTRTVRERLNGLLDTLGRLGVIPTGVRLFVDSSYGVSYLGRGDDKIAVGRDFAHSVVINPDHRFLDFQSAVFSE